MVARSRAGNHRIYYCDERETWCYEDNDKPLDTVSISVISTTNNQELCSAIKEAIENQTLWYGYGLHTSVQVNGKMELSYFKEEE